MYLIFGFQVSKLLLINEQFIIDLILSNNQEIKVFFEENVTGIILKLKIFNQSNISVQNTENMI